MSHVAGTGAVTAIAALRTVIVCSTGTGPGMFVAGHIASGCVAACVGSRHPGFMFAGVIKSRKRTLQRCKCYYQHQQPVCQSVVRCTGFMHTSVSSNRGLVRFSNDAQQASGSWCSSTLIWLNKPAVFHSINTVFQHQLASPDWVSRNSSRMFTSIMR